jgi:hypothetical protein
VRSYQLAPYFVYLLPVNVLSKLKAAEINAKWLNACGVLPICSPEIAISSEKIFRWFPKLSIFSNMLTAWLRYFSSYAPA